MIDAWSGPTPVAQQTPHREQDGIKKLFGIIRQMQTQIRESASNLLTTAGIHIAPTGMTIDTGLTVSGSIASTGSADFAGPTTIGGTLDVAGAMSVLGTLSLPAGIIGNDALASPISADSASASQTNFAVSTADTTYAAGSIPVPAGFTRALVFVVANVGVINPSLNVDYIYAKAVINGVASREMFALAGSNGGSASIATAKADLLTGLGGGSISVSTQAHSQVGPWSANASNRAYMEALAIFLR